MVPRRQGRTYRIGDHILSSDNPNLTTISGDNVYLRPLSHAVLLYLVDNHDRVISKQELLDKLWAGKVVTDNSVDACISDIRAKLEDKQAIRTYHRRGYQYAGEVIQTEAPTGVAEPSPQRARINARLLAAAALVLIVGSSSLYVAREGNPTQRAQEAGWWRLGDATDPITDHSGGANPGKPHGHIQALDEDTPGGPAARLTGQTYITGDGANKNFPSGSDPFTITAWTRVRSGGPHGGNLFEFGSSSNRTPRSAAHIWINPAGHAAFGWAFGYESVSSRTTLIDSRWHHIAGVYDGPGTGMLRLFVDGQSAGDSIVSPPPAVTLDHPWFIAVFNAGGDPLDADISDVRLFRGAVTHPEMTALYRCGLHRPDLELPLDGKPYLIPLYRATIEAGERPPNAPLEIEYSGFGKGGVQFAAAGQTNCSLASLRGAELPSDLNISAEVKISRHTAGGPFFGAAKVTPGDPIECKDCTGVWVRLTGEGRVAVHSLARDETANDPPLAISAPQPRFDANAWHKLSAEITGARLRAWLDGKPIAFGTPASETVELLRVPPGAGGIAFVNTPVPTGSVYARNITVQPVNARK